MSKTATVIGIGLLLFASQALAGGDRHTVAVAGSGGICVRVDSPSAINGGNVMGSAVNTAGVSRANTAVKVGGRVFLTAGGSGYHQALAAAPAPREQPAARPPMGLGALLAKLVGLSG